MGKRIWLWVCGLALGTVAQAQVVNTEAMRSSAEMAILAQMDALGKDWRVGKHVRQTAHEEDIPALSAAQYRDQLKSVGHSLGIPTHDHVERYIALFTRAMRPQTEAILGLANIHLPEVVGQLRARKMPQELAWIPFALSGMNPRAVSPQGGAGLWMLPHPIARAYGLEINEHIDQRRDVKASTAAALAWLGDLHERYGRWDHSLAAFFCGPAGLQRALNRSGEDAGIWEVYDHLPESGKDYLPAFLAATYVGAHFEQHKLTPLEIEEPKNYITTPLNRKIDIRAVAEVLGVEVEEIESENPTIRRHCSPEGLCLMLPTDKGSLFSARYDKIVYLTDSVYWKKEEEAKVVEEEKFVIPAGKEEVEYTIKSGDNLGLIASWFNVRVSQLRDWNELRGDRIVAGDKLVIYVPKEKLKYYARLEGMSRSQKQASIGIEEKPVEPQSPEPQKSSPQVHHYENYTVKSGDTLWEIAKHYPGTSDQDIMRANGNSAAIKPGQILKIPVHQ